MVLSIKEQINEFLERNLFLSKEIRLKIESSPEFVLEKILPILKKIDDTQTKLIKSAISKNPNFFGDLQNGMTHEVLAEIMKKEMTIHQEEINEAEAELKKMLETIK